jgi:hypothetical protein
MAALMKKSGKDAAAAVRAKLTLVFSQEFANKCNFFGKNNKIKLVDKEIITMIRGKSEIEL